MSISFEQYYRGIVPVSIDRSNFSVKLNYNATLTTTSGDLGINLGNANTWGALQTFGNNISIGGATLDIASLTSGDVLYYNGTNWINEALSSFGVSGIGGNTTSYLIGDVKLVEGSGITISQSSPDITIANAGVLSLQGDTGALSLTANSGISISGLGIGIDFGGAYTWTAEQTFSNNVILNSSNQINFTTLSSTGYVGTFGDTGGDIFGFSRPGVILLSANVSTYEILTKNNTLDDGYGNMTIAGHLNANDSIYFTGQGGGAYISENMNLHFPNATSTYTWRINNGGGELFQLGIGSGNTGEVTLYNNLNMQTHQIIGFGYTNGGLVDSAFTATTMTGVVMLDTDNTFNNGTGQTIIVLSQEWTGASTGAPGSSAEYTELINSTGNATYVHFGILGAGGNMTYLSESMVYFWISAG